MSVENANVIAALFGVRSDAALLVQYLGGSGVIAASLARTGAGEYTIDLEQALSKLTPAFPAVGRVDYALQPNLELGLAWTISAELIVGATPGRFDRIALHVRNAGVAADPPATAPITVTVLRFPSVD